MNTQRAELRIRTGVRAGGLRWNHTVLMVRSSPRAAAPRVQTGLRAGGFRWNHAVGLKVPRPLPPEEM